jgi:hypothetical protein
MQRERTAGHQPTALPRRGFHSDEYCKHFVCWHIVNVTAQQVQKCVEGKCLRGRSHAAVGVDIQQDLLTGQPL